MEHLFSSYQVAVKTVIIGCLMPHSRSYIYDGNLVSFIGNHAPTETTVDVRIDRRLEDGIEISCLLTIL